jgi:hypothetical protein
MATQLYYRDAVVRILELLKDNFGEAYGIAAFYEGDPVIFGTSSLPAICVMKRDASYDVSATQTDEITTSILIKLVLDKREDYGGSTTIDLTDKRLRTMIEGRDQTTAQYATESLMGILRTFYTMNYSNPLNPILTQTEKVSYHLVDRTSMHDETLVTMEGHILVTLRERVQVNGRN